MSRQERCSPGSAGNRSADGRVRIPSWFGTTVFIIAAMCFSAMLGPAAEKAVAQTYKIHPVGWVSKTGGQTVIEILPQFRDALLGLETYSHAIILYWFDRNDTPEKRSILRVHPRRDLRNPLRGVFAARSPVRPNLIAFSVCRIEAVEETRIILDRIDALDRTPVIDIKPYRPGKDCVPDAVSPSLPSDSRPQ